MYWYEVSDTPSPYPPPTATNIALYLYLTLLRTFSVALAELYIVIACLFWRFDLELVDTIRERDVDSTRDCFVGEAALDSPGIRVRILDKEGLSKR